MIGLVWEDKEQLRDGIYLWIHNSVGHWGTGETELKSESRIGPPECLGPAMPFVCECIVVLMLLLQTTSFWVQKVTPMCGLSTNNLLGLII